MGTFYLDPSGMELLDWHCSFGMTPGTLVYPASNGQAFRDDEVFTRVPSSLVGSELQYFFPKPCKTAENWFFGVPQLIFLTSCLTTTESGKRLEENTTKVVLTSLSFLFLQEFGLSIPGGLGNP